MRLEIALGAISESGFERIYTYIYQTRTNFALLICPHRDCWPENGEGLVQLLGDMNVDSPGRPGLRLESDYHWRSNSAESVKRATSGSESRNFKSLPYAPAKGRAESQRPQKLLVAMHAALPKVARASILN